MLKQGHRDALEGLQRELNDAREKAVAGEQAMENARTNAKMMKKREQEFQKKELALEYRILKSNDEHEEMLSNNIAAKMEATEARTEVDDLKRENRELIGSISDVKRQLAELKAKLDDEVAQRQHAESERQRLEAMLLQAQQQAAATVHRTGAPKTNSFNSFLGRNFRASSPALPDADIADDTNNGLQKSELQLAGNLTSDGDCAFLSPSSMKSSSSSNNKSKNGLSTGEASSSDSMEVRQAECLFLLSPSKKQHAAEALEVSPTAAQTPKKKEQVPGNAEVKELLTRARLEAFVVPMLNSGFDSIARIRDATDVELEGIVGLKRAHVIKLRAAQEEAF